MSSAKSSENRPMTESVAETTKSLMDSVLSADQRQKIWGKTKTVTTKLEEVRQQIAEVPLEQKEFVVANGFTNFSSALVAGSAAGLAGRKFLKTGLIVGGCGFICLQALNNKGLVKVDWDKIEKKGTNFLDLNNDGKVDSADFKIAKERTLKYLTQGIPNAAGFSTGFYLGLKGRFMGIRID